MQDTNRGAFNAGEVACGAALAVAGVVFAWSAWGLPEGEPGVPGPGAVPFALGVIFACLGSIAMARSILRSKKVGSAIDWRALLAIAFLAAASFLFDQIGFLLVSSAFLMVGFRYLGDIPWSRAIAVALAFSLALHFIFVKALGVALPSGLLEPLLGS